MKNGILKKDANTSCKGGRLRLPFNHLTQNQQLAVFLEFFHYSVISFPLNLLTSVFGLFHRALVQKEECMATSPSGGIPITTSFYKNEYFDVCEINGSKFALFNKQIEARENLNIDLSNYNVVFLAPLVAGNNILIKAVSVIALNTLNAQRGECQIKASEKAIFLGATVKSNLDIKIHGVKGVFTCGCIRGRWNMLLEEFNTGISNMHGPTIVNALINTFDAIENPSEESEDINTFKAFEFFNISSDA
jgi:hypothetical protein